MIDFKLDGLTLSKQFKTVFCGNCNNANWDKNFSFANTKVEEMIEGTLMEQCGYCVHSKGVSVRYVCKKCGHSILIVVPNEQCFIDVLKDALSET